MSKCEFWDICVTPNWHKEDKKSFIEEVCSTGEHKKCIHFMGLKAQGYKPNTEEWNRIAEGIKKELKKRERRRR
jgi:hypothetical protein